MSLLTRISACTCLFLLCAGEISAGEGDPDPTFSDDGRVDLTWGSGWAKATSVAALSDGSILVGGTMKVASTAYSDLAVVRFLSDGTLDEPWGDGGSRIVPISSDGGTHEELFEVVPISGGRSVLLGSTVMDNSRQAPALARLTAEGDLDPAFGDGGIAVGNGSEATVVIARAATAVPGGYLFFGWCDFIDTGSLFLYRTDLLGDPDEEFGDEGWVYLDVGSDPLYPSAITVQADGKILLAWNPDTYRVRLERRMADGAPDLEFGSSGGLTMNLGLPNDWIAHDLAIDPNDGAIYIGLGQRYPNGALTGSIARVTASGDFDEQFGFPDLTLEEGSDISSIAITSDRKVMAAGTIDANGEQPSGFFLARLLSSGAFDDSFDDNGVQRVEFDLRSNGIDAAAGLALSGGKPVIAGFATRPGLEALPSFAILRLQNSVVFDDGFEVGSWELWNDAFEVLP